jgi:hypothetical protein
MRRASAFSRWAPLALAGVALLGGPLPSRAYRMLEGPNSGTTSGTQSKVTCGNLDGFAHWNSRTIYWYHNTAGAGSGKAAALQAALAAWSTPNISDTSYNLVYAGTTTAGVANDNRNTFVWGPTGSVDLCNTTACHAVTVLHLDAGRVIKDVDIVFNNTMDWRTDDSVTGACTTATAGTPLDTRAIATHELGHSLGIHHPEGSIAVEPSRSATMGAQSCNVDGRSLSNDDMEALRCSEDRYPSSPSFEGTLEVANCATVSGWAWNANRPNRTSYVELQDLGVPIAVLAANAPRPDLVGKGNGLHGFSLGTPSDYRNGTWKSVIAKFGATSTNLSSSPQAVACNVPLFSSQPGSSDSVSNGGVPYEVSTQFAASHNGKITEIDYYFPAGETPGTHTARLWSDTGTLLAQANFSTPSFGAAGWSGGNLYTPGGTPTTIPITAGVRYRVSVTTLGVRSVTACSSTAPKSLYSPITNGPLTAHQSFWSLNPNASQIFPTTSSCDNFWVSVRFDKT